MLENANIIGASIAFRNRTTKGYRDHVDPHWLVGNVGGGRRRGGLGGVGTGPPRLHRGHRLLFNLGLVELAGVDLDEQRLVLLVVLGGLLLGAHELHQHPLADQEGRVPGADHHLDHALVGAFGKFPKTDDVKLDLDLVLDDGDTVDGTEFRLEVLHTPGHAPNPLCFLLDEERALPHTLACLERAIGEHGDTEVIAVDSGSRDGSRAILAAQANGLTLLLVGIWIVYGAAWRLDRLCGASRQQLGYGGRPSRTASHFSQPVSAGGRRTYSRQPVD